MVDPTDSAEDDEVLEESKAQRRTDVRAAKKSVTQQAARRADSEDDDTPIDGWGDPLKVETVPGWKACFVSEFDAERFGWRDWTVATWEDPRILKYVGTKKGEKGSAIKYKELTMYLITEEAFAKAHRRDPRRHAHNGLREAIVERAETSGAFDPVSGQAIPNATRGFMNHITR